MVLGKTSLVFLANQFFTTRVYEAHFRQAYKIVCHVPLEQSHHTPMGMHIVILLSCHHVSGVTIYAPTKHTNVSEA